jgi:hypothetical protein
MNLKQINNISFAREENSSLHNSHQTFKKAASFAEKIEFKFKPQPIGADWLFQSQIREVLDRELKDDKREAKETKQ